MEQLEFQSLVLNRFENMDEHMRDLKQDMHDVKEELRDHRHILMDHDQKLNQILADRHKVKITFGWQWGMASFVIAICAAGLARIVV